MACDALTEDAMAEPATDPAVEKAWARFCLENCRLYAARHRKEEWAKTILRFCDEAGVNGSPLREALNTARESELHAAQEADELRASLKAVLNHWREFGPEHGFDECVERAAGCLCKHEPTPNEPWQAGLL